MWKLAFCLLLTLIFSAGCLAQAGNPAGGMSSSEVTQPTPTPEPAHNFDLASLAGSPVALSDFRGRWVLVNFWATWCPPCVAEMPYLQQLSVSRDLVVIAINMNEPEETVARFVSTHRLSFPVLLNPDDITLLVYQARSLPRTFLIAPNGTIALRIIGPVDPAHFNPWLNDHLPGFPQ